MTTTKFLSPLAARHDEFRRANDDVATARRQWVERNRYFYDQLAALLRFIIPPSASILHYGAELGQLLEGLSPREAVAVNVSARMSEQAERLASGRTTRFVCADAEELQLAETFDYLLYYTLGNILDIERALLAARPMARPDSRVVVVSYSQLWRPLVTLAEAIGWKVPQPRENWLNGPAIANLFELAGYQVIKNYRQLLIPVSMPLLSRFANGVLAKLPPLKPLCFVELTVARKVSPAPPAEDVTVSVIVPCKNERGNIEDAVRRIPEMGKRTEILFCDDRSTDGTLEEIQRVQRAYPQRDIRLVHGPGVCKAQNVWAGFDAASGDVLMILDADLTVPPEELPYFFQALVGGHGEFVNGTRMIYPMEDDAMRTPNIIGNKGFSLLFSYLLGQRLTDTLCGTKVFWRRDWPRLRELIGSWGVADRWGDYELIFGAAKLHLEIVEVPVHYLDRTYGATKMTRRFANGLVMLRMWLAALKKFKFA